MMIKDRFVKEPEEFIPAQCVLFDMDGTLADSLPLCVEAFPPFEKAVLTGCS